MSLRSDGINEHKSERFMHLFTQQQRMPYDTRFRKHLDRVAEPSVCLTDDVLRTPYTPAHSTILQRHRHLQWKQSLHNHRHHQVYFRH